VFSASDESAIGPDPAFFANSGTTLALPFLQTPGAGTLSFVSGQLEITLIDFVWSDPAVHSLDRVGGLSTGPDGQNESVGQFTLQVTAIPEPSTLILLGFGLLGLIAFRKKFKVKTF